jgi:hypothetical protein
MARRNCNHSSPENIFPALKGGKTNVHVSNYSDFDSKPPDFIVPTIHLPPLFTHAHSLTICKDYQFKETSWISVTTVKKSSFLFYLSLFCNQPFLTAFFFLEYRT